MSKKFPKFEPENKGPTLKDVCDAAAVFRRQDVREMAAIVVDKDSTISDLQPYEYLAKDPELLEAMRVFGAVSETPRVKRNLRGFLAGLDLSSEGTNPPVLLDPELDGQAPGNGSY